MLKDNKYMLNHKFSSQSSFVCLSILLYHGHWLDVADFKTVRIFALASVNAENAQTNASATEVISSGFTNEFLI